MNPFIIRYGDRTFRINDFDEAKVILTDNNVTDFYDDAIYTWYLVVFSKDRSYRIITSAYSDNKLNAYCNLINSAFEKGRYKVSLKKIRP